MKSSSSHQKFLCPLNYKNDLPDLPFDPKLLEYPFDPERHFIYKPTTLEKEEKQQILPEATLGIPLNLIDPLAYYCSVEQKEQGLPTKDSVLFSEHNKKSKNENDDLVTWIRQPEFLMADFKQEILYGKNKPKTKTNQMVENDLLLEKNTTIHIDAIEKTFEDSENTPIHPTDPSIKPVEIIEVLPGEDYWQHDFRIVGFEQNPIPHPPDKNADDYDILLEEQEELCLWGIITPVVINSEEFGIFIVPKLEGYEDLNSFAELDISDRKYEFIREYSFKSFDCDPSKNLTITVDEEHKCAYYNLISIKMELKKKLQKREHDFYPSVIHLNKVEPTEEDEEIFKSKLASIQPQFLVDEEHEDIVMADILGSDSDSEEDEI